MFHIFLALDPVQGYTFQIIRSTKVTNALSNVKCERRNIIYAYFLAPGFIPYVT